MNVISFDAESVYEALIQGCGALSGAGHYRSLIVNAPNLSELHFPTKKGRGTFYNQSKVWISLNYEDKDAISFTHVLLADILGKEHVLEELG